ncbi:hypothetical protein Tco_1387591, partial [Tanacetum coccineum]
MLAKQNDQISKEKKIHISPINYSELNKLSEDFGKRFVPQKQLSADEAFLDLEPLSPKLLKKRDAHIDYIKHTQEHADTLREIVKHTRALRPLDSDLDSACQKFTIDGNRFPLTRITSTNVVPPKNPLPTK